MPRADFYVIAKPRFRANPLLLVCELARKGYDANQAMLILAQSFEQAETLDDLLWGFDPEAYLPHQIVGTDDDEDITPILIAAPEHAAAPRPLIINLRQTAWEGPCERILEVVPADPSARIPLRKRWRAYKLQGFDVTSYAM